DREGRRVVAKPSDRFVRVMRVLTEGGVISLPIKDSRTASQISKYWNAVEHYLSTGDSGPLNRFRGKFFRVNKLAYPFITDIAVIDLLGSAGELQFDDIYDDSPAA